MDKKEKKPFFKRPLVWVVVALVIIFAAAASSRGDNGSNNTNTTNTPTDSKPEEKKPEKLSLQETYDKLSSGMTKDEVEAIIGKDSGSCCVTEDDFVGKMESCTYGGAIFDSGMLMITYDNDKLYNKTINKW